MRQLVDHLRLSEELEEIVVDWGKGVMTFITEVRHNLGDYISTDHEILLQEAKRWLDNEDYFNSNQFREEPMTLQDCYYEMLSWWHEENAYYEDGMNLGVRTRNLVSVQTGKRLVIDTDKYQSHIRILA